MLVQPRTPNPSILLWDHNISRSSNIGVKSSPGMASKRSIEQSHTTHERDTKRAESNNKSEERDGGERPLVIKCKTTFKKLLVERALQKEEERDSEDDRSEEPLVKYFVKYSVKRELLSVGGLEVIVDETNYVLRCSQCSFASKQGWNKEKRSVWEIGKMEYGMRNHIVGQHLGGFPCKECKPIPVFHQSLSAHQKHKMEMHNEERKEVEARIRGSLEGGGISDSRCLEEDEIDPVWPNGQRRMRRPWKCSVASCGKRFYQVKRWIRHEKDVHGKTVQVPDSV